MCPPHRRPAPALERLLARALHDLRTPLQSTLSWGQVVTRLAAPGSREAMAAGRIVDSARRQAQLLDELHDSAQLLGGTLRLAMQPVDLAALLADAVDPLRRAALAQGSEIELVVDPGGGADLHCDPARLAQLVRQLLANAVQAGGAGGRVRLIAAVHGPTLRLEVRDWGRGLSAADLARLFGPADGAGAGDLVGGRGLGLTIVHAIVALFGGSLAGHSDGPGLGSCVLVSLPVADAGGGAAAAAPSVNCATEPGLPASEPR